MGVRTSYGKNKKTGRHELLAKASTPREFARPRRPAGAAPAAGDRRGLNVLACRPLRDSSAGCSGLRRPSRPTIKEGPWGPGGAAKARDAGARPVRVNSTDLTVEALHRSPLLEPGPGGEIYLPWSSDRPKPEGTLFASDLRLSRSLDGRRSFDTHLRVIEDRPISHSFDGLAVGPDGIVLLSWRASVLVDGPSAPRRGRPSPGLPAGAWPGTPPPARVRRAVETEGFCRGAGLVLRPHPISERRGGAKPGTGSRMGTGTSQSKRLEC
jgi:hypothetical protein